jgi:hypothetical protein
MQNVIYYTKNTQWTTARIKANYKHKKSLYSLSKTTNSPIIKAHYTQYRTILQKVIRKVKHLYCNILIKTSGNKIQIMENNK